MSIIFRDDESSDPEGQSPPTRGTVGGDSSMDDDSLIQKSFDDEEEHSLLVRGDGSPNARIYGSDKENASPPRPQFGNVSQCLKSGAAGVGAGETCRDSFLDLEQQIMVDGAMMAANNNKKTSSSSLPFPSSKVSSSSASGHHQPKMIFSPEKAPSTPSFSSPFLHASDHGSMADFNLGSPGHHLAHMGGGRTSFDDEHDQNGEESSATSSRKSINYFDPIQCAGLVTYSDITSFMEEQCGTSSSPPSTSAPLYGGRKKRFAKSSLTTTSTSTARTTFHVLDYLMVLHQVAPELVDLSAICWSTNPVRSQLEQNAKIFVEAAEKISSKYGLPSITDSYLIKFGDSSDSSSSHISPGAAADPHRLVMPTFEPVPAHNEVFLRYQREVALESSPTNFLSSPDGDDLQYQYDDGTSKKNCGDDNGDVSGAGLHAIVITALVDSTVDPGGVHLALQSWLYRADKTLLSLTASSADDESPVVPRPVASGIRSAAMRKYCHTQAPLRAMFEQGYNEAAQNLVMTAHGRIKEAQASAAADAAKIQAQKAESAATKSRFALVPNCASRPHRSTTPPVTGLKRERGASSTGNLPPSRKPPIPEAARRSGGNADPSKTVEEDSITPSVSTFVLTAAPFPNLSDLSRPRYTLEQQVSDACMVQVFAEALEEQIYQTTMKFYSVLGESDPVNRDRLWKEVAATASKDASEFVAPRMKL